MAKSVHQFLIMSLMCASIFFSASSFTKSKKGNGSTGIYTNVLADTIYKITKQYTGEIGVALLVNNTDTVTINNRRVYPMMSVFKLHQALAVCNDFDRKELSLDSVMVIERDSLDARTWSPMLKEHHESEIKLTVKDLLRYTLIQSDNNASNLMFNRLVSKENTDSFITTLIPRSSFQIAYTESEMSADHAKAYSNYTTPLGAAVLMNRLFTESLVSKEKLDFVKKTLGECLTGKDRIVAPLFGRKGVTIAHKTGSGYTNEQGLLVAHNDVAYICLPNGVCYTLAVFIKDFDGNEKQASVAIARISDAVYFLLSKKRK